MAGYEPFGPEAPSVSTALPERLINRIHSVTSANSGTKVRGAMATSIISGLALGPVFENGLGGRIISHGPRVGF